MPGPPLGLCGLPSLFPLWQPTKELFPILPPAALHEPIFCLPRSSRLWTQPKSCRPHARGLDFGPRSTHAKKRGSRIVRKCRGRADLGRKRDFFDPRNFAWVEQNLAPARFGPTLGPGQVWPRTDVGPGPRKSVTQKNNHFFKRFRRGPPKGYACYGPN